MADEDDVNRLRQNEFDMVGSDLRGGSFQGMDISQRNFSASQLGKVEFLDCDLTGCDFRSADLANASFRNSKMQGAKLDGALFRNDFSGTDLRGATISGLLYECNFTGADLRGTNFVGSRLTEAGTFFEGAQFDEETNFDGVHALRQYTKSPIFENYTFEKGRFYRKAAEPTPNAELASEAAVVYLEESNNLVDVRADSVTTNGEDRVVVGRDKLGSSPELVSFDLYEPFVVRNINVAAAATRDRLARLIEETAGELVLAEPAGSNYPPPEILINEDERRHIFEALDLTSRLDISDRANRELLQNAGKRIARAASQLASWVAAKLDRAADSFAEAAGAAVAKFALYFGAYQLMSGQLFTLADALLKALGSA